MNCSVIVLVFALALIAVSTLATAQTPAVPAELNPRRVQ